MIQYIISAYLIICDIKEIAKKAKTRSLRKLPNGQDKVYM